MKISPILLLVTVSTFIQPCAGRVVENLTLARVPVLDRSDIEFARGTAKALEAVLVKLTGDSRVPRTSEGRAVLAKAKRLVQQFGYEKAPRALGADDELLLRVEFDAQALSEEMLGQGLVLWGKERPETVIYVTIRNENGSNVLSQASLGAQTPEAEILSIIERQAARRGIPVRFPDLSAAALVDNATDIDPSLLIGAADGLAIANFEKSPSGIWDSRWSIQISGEQQSFSNEGDMVTLLAEEATDSLADLIGRRFANPNVLGHLESIQLKISGIRDGRDFARVTQYLNSLDSVRDLFIQSTQGSEMIVRASIQGGYQGLGQSLSFGNVLVPLGDLPGEYQVLVPGI